MSRSLAFPLEPIWWRSGLILATLSASVGLILTGHQDWLVLLTGALAITFVLWRWPLVGVLALLIFSTQSLKLVYTEHLPSWRVGPGLRINVFDAVLLCMTAISLFKLYRRRARPLFFRQMTGLFALMIVCVAGSILLGNTPADGGVITLRMLFSYASYFIFVEVMETPRRLRAVAGMLFAIALASVFIQGGELLSGQRLNFGLTNSSYYGQVVEVDVQGTEAVYLWNRAVEYLFVSLFLALGCIFEGQRPNLFWPVVMAGLVAFGMMLVRQWQIYIIVGVAAILFVLLRAGRVRIILGTVVVVSALSVGLLFATARFMPLMIWLNRLETLSNPMQEGTFLSRVEVIKAGLEYFKAAPWFGYGLGQIYQDLFNSDVGFINTLLVFGSVGMLAVMILITATLLRVYQAWQRMPLSVERGWMLGLLGLWIALIAGYSFATDFFTRSGGIWMVTVVMALVDRLSQMNATSIPSGGNAN